MTYYISDNNWIELIERCQHTNQHIFYNQNQACLFIEKKVQILRIKIFES